MPDNPLTPTQQRVLEIMDAVQRPLSKHGLARWLWPNGPTVRDGGNWRRLNQKAGTILWHMKRAGYVSEHRHEIHGDDGWCSTQKGCDALRAALAGEGEDG